MSIPGHESKVLLFSDIHVACHKRSTERLNDCLKTLEWVFETAVHRKLDNILFLGDLFHDRQKIDVLTYQKTFEVFEKYLYPKPPFDIYLLLGNHDLWHLQKWDVSSVNPLRTLPGVTVIDKPSTINIAGFPISFLPYTHNPIADLLLLKNDSLWKMLCGHLAVDGAVLNKMHGTTADVSIEHDGDMQRVATDVFVGWDQVFLGHYHGEQQLQYNIEYVGSPLQLSFGEAFQHKHIIVFDLATHDKEYIRNTFSPQHLIIPQAKLDKYKLEGNFIRIIADDIAACDLIEMRKDMIENKKVGSFEIKPAKKEDEEHVVENAKAILFKEDEMLEKYVDEVEKGSGLGDLKKDKLLEIAKAKLICEAEQI